MAKDSRFLVWGEWLKKYLDSKGWVIYRIAQAIEEDERTLRNWTNRGNSPRVHTFYKFCQHIGESMDDMVSMKADSKKTTFEQKINMLKPAQRKYVSDLIDGLLAADATQEKKVFGKGLWEQTSLSVKKEKSRKKKA